MENIKDSLEFEGKSVEEAVKKALAALKVQKKDLVIRVLSEEQRGLFGMPGFKPAKISVSLVAGSKTTKKKT